MLMFTHNVIFNSFIIIFIIFAKYVDVDISLCI